MAVYNANGESLEDAKIFNILAYNVGNFSDGTEYGYEGDDLDGYVKEWTRFFGGVHADVCLLSESRLYVDNANTLPSKEGLYQLLYKNVSNYNPLNPYGIALLSDEQQKYLVYDHFQQRISSDSKYIGATLRLNGIDVFVVAVHANHTVEGHEQESIAVRTAQLNEIISIASTYDNVIIGGDFNVNNVSEYSVFTNAGYKIANGGIFGDFDTWSEDDPQYPCDSVVVKGSKLQLKDFSVFKGVTNGDHLATIAKILVG